MSDNLFVNDDDLTLRRALRDAAPPPPLEDVDWYALHARVTSAAQQLPALQAQPVPASLSQPATVWQPLARWSPFGIPLAAAAAVVLMLGVASIGARQVAFADEDVAFLTIEEELVNGLGSSVWPLLAGVGGDAMIDVALFHDGEDW